MSDWVVKDGVLKKEQAVLAVPCPQCGFNFPRLGTTPTSFAVFKDVE